jgi:ABC-type antimicrobial peptide transport system permease subunit
MIRTADADAAKASVRNEVRAIDVDVAVYRMRTVQEASDEELSSSRVLTGMFAAFAILALVLAGSGLYGVISYSVSQRVQEIGVRIALGAVTSDIRALILRQTLVLVAVGATTGLIGGALIATTASSILYDVSPSDPITYVTVATLLITVAAFAASEPVRRATRVDPVTALRN